jgi:uncharacterized protein YqeY
MSLKERMTQDLRAAMRSHDTLRRDVLRMAQNALQYGEIAKGAPLEEAEEVEALRRQVRQRKESIEAFQQAGRQDRADLEVSELAILDEYLPAQKTREEVEALARQAIADVGAQGAAHKGRVMGKLMPQLRGQADGDLVNAVVIELLEAG